MWLSPFWIIWPHHFLTQIFLMEYKRNWLLRAVTCEPVRDCIFINQNWNIYFLHSAFRELTFRTAWYSTQNHFIIAFNILEPFVLQTNFVLLHCTIYWRLVITGTCGRRLSPLKSHNPLYDQDKIGQVVQLKAHSLVHNNRRLVTWQDLEKTQISLKLLIITS